MTIHRKIYRPRHPRSSASGEIYEHVELAELALGRYLPSGTEVHHVDENPRNNSNGNLVICQDKAYHKLLHTRTRVVRAGGDPDTERICSRCRACLPLHLFNKNQNYCRVCSRASWAVYYAGSKREMA